MGPIPLSLFFIVLAAFALGVIVIIGLGYLYTRSYPRFDADISAPLQHIILNNPHRIPQEIYEYYWNRAATFVEGATAEIVAKREAFWTSLIQSMISLVVVVFIAVLLLLGIVKAEAGLPILAAFGGAALGQGASSSRNMTRGQTPPSPQRPREDHPEPSKPAL